MHIDSQPLKQEGGFEKTYTIRCTVTTCQCETNESSRSSVLAIIDHSVLASILTMPRLRRIIVMHHVIHHTWLWRHYIPTGKLGSLTDIQLPIWRDGSWSWHHAMKRMVQGHCPCTIHLTAWLFVWRRSRRQGRLIPSHLHPYLMHCQLP